jgi:hypothetical protein
MTDLPVTPPTILVVIGSYGWKSIQTVNSVLGEWWSNHGRPPVRLVTSGCPLGAESFARLFGELNEWEFAVMRDEEIPLYDGAFFYAFIRNKSEGAERVLGWLERRGVEVRVVREDTTPDRNPWATR